MRVWFLSCLLLTSCATNYYSPIPLQKDQCETFNGSHWGSLMGDMTLVVCRKGQEVNGALHTNWSGGERAARIEGVFINKNMVLFKETVVLYETTGSEWCSDLRYVVGWTGQELRGTFYSVLCRGNAGSFRLLHQEETRGM